MIRKLLPVLAIVAAVAVAMVLVTTKPEPTREAPTENGDLVQVTEVRYAGQPFALQANGTVIPERQLVVQPQVNGRVEHVSPKLLPGGLVSRGELLFRIEADDYELAVEQARARLAEAEAALALESGRQAVAQREWALFADEVPGTDDPALALREPQLRSAQATVAAAQSLLQQARLNLQRTRIHAPFDAVVRAESVDIGQLVSPQTAAVQLVGTKQFRIQASLPAARLPFIELAGRPEPRSEQQAPADASPASQPGSQAVVRYDTGAGITERQGTVVQILPDLDSAGQMARILVVVDDPLGLHSGDAPLLLNSYVDVVIKSARSSEVIELKPQWVHNGNEVYLYDKGTLAVRQVDIAWRRPNAILVSKGLMNGDRVIISSLASPTPGMKLRLDPRNRTGTSPDG